MANLNVMAEHAEGARSRLCFIVRSFINAFLLPQLLSRLAHLFRQFHKALELAHTLLARELEILFDQREIDVAHLDFYNRLDAVPEAFGVTLLSRKLQFLNARLYRAKFFDAH